VELYMLKFYPASYHSTNDLYSFICHANGIGRSLYTDTVSPLSERQTLCVQRVFNVITGLIALYGYSCI
jgi:hypothetical protein